MRRIVLLPLLLLGSCAGSPEQVNTALKNATILKQVFEHSMTQNEQLFARSSPPPETLQAYMATQMQLRSVFDDAFEAHVKHLGSWAGSPELALEVAKELK